MAPLADQRGTSSSVLSQTRQLRLIAHLNRLSPRLQPQFQSLIRGPLIRHTHRSPSLKHLKVAVRYLLLYLVDKVEMLHLAVSVAMAIVTCDKPLAHKVLLLLAISKPVVTTVGNPHNLHKMI